MASGSLRLAFHQQNGTHARICCRENDVRAYEHMLVVTFISAISAAWLAGILNARGYNMPLAMPVSIGPHILRRFTDGFDANELRSIDQQVARFMQAPSRWSQPVPQG